MGRIEVIPRREMSEWMHRLLDMAGQTGHGEELWTLVTLLGGDRATCCDEAVALKLDDDIVAVATIAPEGEMMSGQPTIVGVYVLPEYRRRGFGQQVTERAILRCIERGLKPVRIDIMSRGMRQIVEKLSPETKGYLFVSDHGDLLDMFS